MQKKQKNKARKSTNRNSSPFCENLQKFQRVDRTTLKYFFLQDLLQISEKTSFKSSKVTRLTKAKHKISK